MKKELELIRQIYFDINISEHSEPDFIKQRLRNARKKLNALSSKLRQSDVITNEVAVCDDGTCVYGTCQEADYMICIDGCVNKQTDL